MGNILQDMMGLLSRKKVVKEVESTDFLVLGRTPNPEDSMFVTPKMTNELISIKDLKSHFDVGEVTGSGTTGYFPLYTDGANSVIGDSQLRQAQLSNGLYQIRMENTDRFIINKPSSVTGGDPEYLVQQDGVSKVSFGWDDDGGGFGFLYNYSGAGLKLGAEGNNPMLEIKTTVGSEEIDLHKLVKFVDYGTGTQTGTVAYTLAVNSSGNIIESDPIEIASTDIAINSDDENIAIGDSAVSANTGSNTVLIGSNISTNASDDIINIGNGNTSTGTGNIVIGSNNSQTVNGGYSILLGEGNTGTGNNIVALGRSNSMGTSDTYTFGLSNSSTFTGGVSSAGMMNLSVGANNAFTNCDKGMVFGWNNDISDSFGFNNGSGKETVVIGTRMTTSLLGPNRSGTERSGPRVIIGTGSVLNSGVQEKRNSVEYYQPEASRSGVFHPALYNSASYADDTAAATGGVRLGELYRNGSIIQIRMA